MGRQLVFIDDSGDPGLKDGTNSSNLVMAGAVFIDPEEATRVNEEISRYRKALGWKEEHEFKFRKAPKAVKIHFLEIVSKHHFEIYAVYVDKTKYPKSFQLSDHEKLYDWTTKELLKAIPMYEAQVRIDGSLNRKHKLRVKSDIRKEVNATGHKIKDIKPQDSTKDNLIQLADMIVGAINRSFQVEKTDTKDYIRIIKKKIALLKELDLE